jgi:predicted Fe-Mo cluster-binding NifX family protein
LVLLRITIPSIRTTFMNATIAVALQPGSLETGHFGHAEAFRVYRDGRFLEQRTTSPFCGLRSPGDDSIDQVLAAIGDCSVVVVSAIGPCGRTALEEAGMTVQLFTGDSAAAADHAALALMAAVIEKEAVQ